MNTADGAWIARHWTPVAGQGVQCSLCPRRCRIGTGEPGGCRVRRNVGGTLIAETYGRPAALQVDPIEKKPLAFYRPGTRTFSVGTFGCNLACRFCQNDHLSRNGCDRTREYPFLEPEKIVELARAHGCESVALTYNEPTVFFEYACDIARAAREAGLGTVLVSNGWIEEAPRRELYGLIDAANLDIKGSDSFYRTLCGATADPVWASCRVLKHACGAHLEITNLLIPGANDSESDLRWLLERAAEELGTDTPVHFSAYFPAAGFTAPPTPAETLYRAQRLAGEYGFPRVRLGNLR